MDLKKPKQDTPIKKQKTKVDITTRDLYELIKSNKISRHLDVQSRFGNLETHLATFKKSFDLLSAELARVKDASAKLEAKIELLNNKLLLVEKNNISSQHLVYNATNELRELISKEKNVVIFNVPDKLNEDSSETTSIGNSILKFLNVSPKVSTIQRLGSFNNKLRPVLIEMASKTDVFTIMKEKKGLRQSDQWKSIYINMDTTALQRNVMKNLRLELNQKRASDDDSWVIKYVKGTPTLMKKN